MSGKLLKSDLGVDLGFSVAALGYGADALSDRIPSSRWLHATKAFLDGDPRTAADIYAEIGSRPDEAYARLEGARLYFAEGRAQEANAELDQALAFYREVGADAYMSDAEALRLAVA